VFTESITTKSGFIVSITQKISSISQLDKKFIFGIFHLKILSALQETCQSDSSHETYKTFFQELAISQLACKTRVDFQTHGSHVKSVIESETNHQPKTLSNSQMFVLILSNFSNFSSHNFAIFSDAFDIFIDFNHSDFFSSLVLITSSTIVFQDLQDGHCHDHFSDVSWQLEQM